MKFTKYNKARCRGDYACPVKGKFRATKRDLDRLVAASNAAFEKYKQTGNISAWTII